jgi:hypothetical protein
MSIVYVNSTLRHRESFLRMGQPISPLHYWGYKPRAVDVSLQHRLNRVEITLRAKLGGIDPDLFLRTCWHLARGARGVYLVTQPDLWQLLPFLRKTFPSRRLVTWAWMDWEVDRHFARLRVCDHVLCLTVGAKRRLDELGFGARSSLAIWGTDPSYYKVAQPVVTDTDVVIAGLVSRDVPLMKEVLATRRYSVRVAERAYRELHLETECGVDIQVASFDTGEAMATAFRQSRVAWIPLLPADRYPSGYTNLVESLLCGTAVVIGDTSTIPEEVLSLPGVFRYRTGSRPDFARRTDDAIAFMRRAGARAAVEAAAAKRLDGAALVQTVCQQLGLNRSPGAPCES